MDREKFSRAVILGFTLGITALFIGMIKGFLIAIFMAAIFTGLLYPVHAKFRSWFNGRESPAAFGTILFFIFLILIPVGLLLYVIVEEAVAASRSAGPILDKIIKNPSSVLSKVENIPFVQQIIPDHEKFTEIIKNVISALGEFVINALSEFTSGTAGFVFSLFIFLFTLYYFLIYGRMYLSKLLYYLPLNNDDEKLLLDRFTRVTRATLKGTFLIGVIQGALGAIAMAFTGIPNVIFWGVLMVVFSIIPALGPAIIWLPAAAYLFLQGNVLNGIILSLWGAIVIGNIDNLLRPKLVGKDAQMPDLMILFGTLGGLALFGISGIIIGPIIGALFITTWDIYGRAFKDLLYPVKNNLSPTKVESNKKK